MAKVALITGITGQDGSLLAESLVKKNLLVYGLMRKASNRNYSNIESLISKKNFKILHVDLLDTFSIERIIKSINPNEIYNFADQDHVSWSFSIPSYSLQVTGLAVIAETIDVTIPIPADGPSLGVAPSGT